MVYTSVRLYTTKTVIKVLVKPNPRICQCPYHRRRRYLVACEWVVSWQHTSTNLTEKQCSAYNEIWAISFRPVRFANHKSVKIWTNMIWISERSWSFDQFYLGIAKYCGQTWTSQVTWYSDTSRNSRVKLGIPLLIKKIFLTRPASNGSGRVLYPVSGKK